MEDIGRRLLEPLAVSLPETIYFIPAGHLLGFPLDALRLNGRYLLEQHEVINLVSFPQMRQMASLVLPLDQQKTFIAGFPQDYSGDYAIRLHTSAEIQAVADFFIGPGLNIVQGAALLPDEFGSDNFTAASLVHLEMPGVLQLDDPGNARLELSGFEGSQGRAELRTGDIQSQELAAELVFLSNTRTQGVPSTAFSCHAAFVTVFVNSGAKSVIARLWGHGGGASLYFIEDFYRQLAATGNAATALLMSKRRYMALERAEGSFDWAGYQFFMK
jgi:CHAT domain-containing protein